MMNSTMEHKIHFKKIVFPFLVAFFWIGIWYLLAFIIGNDYLMPTPHHTVNALFTLMSELTFYKVVLYTLLRVVVGVLLGIVGGCLFAIASHHSEVFRRIFTPLITIIKATPVVTFIVLLWISMSGNALTVFIAFLMVMPIIWQNLLDGYDSIPTELKEVGEVFEFSPLKKFKVIIAPALLRFLFPAIITSIGLAWKAEIAAEIIAYTKVSIGQYIYDARYNLYTDKVFAWVIVIVSFSILLEFLTKKAIRRFEK